MPHPRPPGKSPRSAPATKGGEGRDPEGHAVPPPLGPLCSASNNLPIQATSFIGREREIAEAKSLISRARLLTLTGTGGCGKSRFALQVGAELLKEFLDGVWLVALAGLRDLSLVPTAVASALGVEANPRLPITDTLQDHLRQRSLLLLLDNCEHLRPACAGLSEMLIRACPSLRIMATSREVLGCEGEVTYRVPSLSVPMLTPLPPLEGLKQSEAVRLFTERTITVMPSFQVTDENASAVARICCRLDGLPLAIEMAAARMRVLSAEQVHVRLDDRFRLLTAGGRQTVPQHQTLQATLDWSHALLSQKERALLARLSSFAGGWTVEAAESICSGGGVAMSEILDLLTQLVDKSLVLVERRGGEVRFRLLETIREYSLERLREADEVTSLRWRHLDWYVGLAERAELELHGSDQARWWGELDLEHDNLRAALQWSLREESGAAAGLRLGGALALFWRVRGYALEGRGWLERVLSRGGGGPSSVRVKALCGAAFLDGALGQYGRGTALAQEALRLARETGDANGTALSLARLGEIAVYRCDLKRAKTHLRASLKLYQDAGDKWSIAWVLSDLADAARLRGDDQAERSLCEQMLSMARGIGDERRVSIALRDLGFNALRRGDRHRATALFSEALGIARTIGAKNNLLDCLAGLGEAAALDGKLGRAARLLAAAQARLEALALANRHQAEYAHYGSIARAGMGEQAFATAWAEGRTMTLEQAVEYGLGGLPASPPAERTGGRGQGPLTARERQVAALVASGLTNREIAALLATSGRTVESHVEHALAKLGFHSRSQIAVWAVEQGLRAHGRTP